MKSITVIAKVRIDDVAEGISDEELCRNLKRIAEIEWGGTVLEIGTETRSAMTATDRQRVIDSLYAEMIQSAFAEGCEDRIANGLKNMPDGLLLALADRNGTWKPAENAKNNL